MPKPMTSPLLVPAAILFLTVAANAQLHSGMPAPMPGVPMTPPPVDHPALGAQPWFNNEASKAPAEPAKETKDPAKKSGKKVKDPDPAVAGPKVAGRDLKKAVDAVKTLKWCNSLAAARDHAGASGKPVLWLQALGEKIDGFA